MQDQPLNLQLDLPIQRQALLRATCPIRQQVKHSVEIVAELTNCQLDLTSVRMSAPDSSSDVIHDLAPSVSNQLLSHERPPLLCGPFGLSQGRVA